MACRCKFNFLPSAGHSWSVNPYLDPEAVRRQQTLISSVVERFPTFRGWLGI